MSTDNTSPQQPSQPEHPTEQHTAPLTGGPQAPDAQASGTASSGQFTHAAPHQPTPGPTAQQPYAVPAPPQGVHPAGGPSSYQPAYQQPQVQQAEPARRRSVLVPVVAAAAGAAVLASGATYALTSTLDDSPSSSLAEVGTSQQAEAAPVASSTNQNPDWQAVTDAVAPSVVAIQVSSQAGGAEGSGVVLDAEGHVLTNNHVVSGGEDGSVQVTLSDGRLYEATIVGTDATTDLAVVQIQDPPSDLAPATVGDSDAVQVGDAVLAVGNPLGLANTATTGIVSALDRPVAAAGEDASEVVVTNAIQIDAAINPGNSGGPMFDSQGRVVGITSSIASLSSGTGGQAGSIGLGFAIPVNLATDVADQLMADGVAEHAFLGVSLGDSTAEADGVTRRGAEVGEVTPGSPAAEAGLQSGDVIVAVDDDAVNGAESLTAFVRERQAGEQATITYVRDGQTQTVDVAFAVREETTGTQDGQGQGQGQGQQGEGQQGQQGQGQGGLGQQDQGQDQQGQGQDGSSDPTQPENIPDWLQELFGN